MIHDERISNKLLVLFVLDKIEIPINEDLLLSICSTDNEWIPYFYCKQIIADLTEAGFITKVNGSIRNPILALTEDGRTCLSHFYNDIPKSVRDTITEYARSTRLSYKKKQEFLCDYKKNSDGSYTVEMSIQEITKPIMQLKFVVPNMQKAISIYNQWGNKAPEVYKAFYDILID
ncbi:MAG: DUF4364 family protein [Bacillota bacterium]